MKRTLKIVFAIIIFIAFTPDQVKAQQMKVGGGLVYASSVNSIGISLNGEYQFTDEWSASPAFTYFLKKDDYWTRMTLDLDANYKFKEIEGVGGLYGIGGLAFTFDSFSWGDSTLDGYNNTSTSLGLNLGIGLNFALAEKMTIAPELRYTIMSGGYLRIGAKFMYSL